jgi:SulP family sulfate permease
MSAEETNRSVSPPEAPSALQRWFPAAVWLRQYSWGTSLRADLVAAVSVVALLVPESMGYSSVAGVPAQVGLYAAPLALIGYALFGGSKVLVFAAAGSVAAVTAGVVSGLNPSDKGATAAMVAALAITTGAVFLVAGLAHMGWIVNFMSKAVMAGFIIGMSIQIIVGQFSKLFGVDTGGGDTFSKLWQAVSQIGDWNWTATAIGVGALVLIFAIQRFTPSLPAALTAVALTSVIVAVFDPDIKLVAEIPEGLPSFAVPSGISASDWLTLLLGGMVVALVGFSEGHGAAATISAKTHDQLDTNQEFRAYGIGNVGAGILGGMAVTGSLSKSSAAMAAGAKTQMSNVFLAAMVLLTLLVFAPAFQWLPETALAAIVINAMWGSASPAKLEKLWHVDRVDFALGLITMVLVLALDLLPAMITGIVLSIIHLIYRTSFPGRSVLGRVADTGDYDTMSWQYGRRLGKGNPDAQPVPHVIVYRMEAPLIYSNADAFKQTGMTLLIKAGSEGPMPTTMVIDCEAMGYVDTTGAAALTDLLSFAQRAGTDLALARLHANARKVLELEGAMGEIGDQRVYDTIRHAVDATTDES